MEHKTFEQLLGRLKQDYPQFRFVKDDYFCWSPTTQEILYATEQKSAPFLSFSVLHELAHAVLQHKHYRTDYELLLCEIEAWERAKELAKSHQITIGDTHIEQCIDSYRDWLYRRSICPACGAKCLQNDSGSQYTCFNCHNSWHVADSRFCRPYRDQINNKKSLATLTVASDF